MPETAEEKRVRLKLLRRMDTSAYIGAFGTTVTLLEGRGACIVTWVDQYPAGSFSYEPITLVSRTEKKMQDLENIKSAIDRSILSRPGIIFCLSTSLSPHHVSPYLVPEGLIFTKITL